LMLWSIWRFLPLPEIEPLASGPQPLTISTEIFWL
jgi:hypothetical protein